MSKQVVRLQTFQTKIRACKRISNTVGVSSKELLYTTLSTKTHSNSNYMKEFDQRIAITSASRGWTSSSRSSFQMLRLSSLDTSKSVREDKDHCDHSYPNAIRSHDMAYILKNGLGFIWCASQAKLWTIVASASAWRHQILAHESMLNKPLRLLQNHSAW
jgi:hypothetical protein